MLAQTSSKNSLSSSTYTNGYFAYGGWLQKMQKNSSPTKWTASPVYKKKQLNKRSYLIAAGLQKFYQAGQEKTSEV